MGKVAFVHLLRFVRTSLHNEGAIKAFGQVRRAKRTFVFVCTFVLCSMHTLASAGVASCPASLLISSQLPTIEGKKTEIQRLEKLGLLCEDSADFHAALGNLLLQLGRFGEAAVSLEKAIMLNAELADAQLNYAISLAALGQRSVAIWLIRQLAERSDTPPDLKNRILREALTLDAFALGLSNRDTDFTPAATSRLKVSGHLQTSFGRETNLSSSTYTKELTLFLANGPVIVPLYDRRAPIAGTAAKVLSYLQMTKPFTSNELQLGALLQSRKSNEETIPMQQFSRFELQWVRALNSGKLHMTLSRHDLEQSEQYAANDRMLSLTYLPDGTVHECRPVMGLAVAAQSYPLASGMDGKVTMLRGELICPFMGQIQLGSSVGVDRPTFSERPGGARLKTEVYFRHLGVLSLRGAQTHLQTNSWIRASKTSDSALFSELLTQQPAETRRVDAGIGLTWALDQRWELGVEFEANSQISGNPLLNLKNHAMYVSSKWKFQTLPR